LFGSHCLIREYGQIDHTGQIRITPYSTEMEAQTVFQKQRGVKERKEYVADLTEVNCGNLLKGNVGE